jgi:hypothetical protein
MSKIVEFKVRKLQEHFCCRCPERAEFFVELWNVDTRTSGGLKYFCAAHAPSLQPEAKR